MLNCWIEESLLGILGDLGIGCITFSPLAQGMLSKKYLAGILADARTSKAGLLSQDLITAGNIRRICELNAIAERRGQSLAQMAIAWVLRDPPVTSALAAARTAEQLADTLKRLENLAFSVEELNETDLSAKDGWIYIWKVSSTIDRASSSDEDTSIGELQRR
jgi:L-glyceraldehyde 3-phosphate reductase